MVVVSAAEKFFEIMDPLSDVLALLKPRSYMFRGLDAGGRWAIRYPAVSGLNCYCLTSGRFCWFIKGSAETVIAKAGEGEIVTLNGGGNCRGVGGFYAFATGPSDLLFGVLPPYLLIRTERDGRELRWCVERMMQELREDRPGRSVVAQDLAQLLLVQALRLYMAEDRDAGTGWLSALSDRRLSNALTAMHGDPGHRWTLDALASLAGMSRSAFAMKFKRTTGSSAMSYLTRWRMVLAGNRILNTNDSVSAIASTLGYESESAFSTAFKRVMRSSPREYSRALSHRS